MEEPQPSNNQRFQKVEVKLGMLAQSKLQNLSQGSLKQVQDRLNVVEKKLADEISSHEASNRDYRLKLRTYQEQCWENDQKFKTALKDRYAQIEDLKQQITNYMQRESQERYQKELWGQTNSHQKIEKIEKEVARMKIDRKEDIESVHQSISRQVACHEASVQPAAHRLNSIVNDKCEAIKAQGSRFRGELEVQAESREKADQKVMDFLKGTVSEIKGALAGQREDRQQKKERLRGMLQDAARSLAGKDRQ